MSLWVICGRAFKPPLAPPSPSIAEEPGSRAFDQSSGYRERRRRIKTVSPTQRAAAPMTSSMNKLHSAISIGALKELEHAETAATSVLVQGAIVVEIAISFVAVPGSSRCAPRQPCDQVLWPGRDPKGVLLD